jgi:hypothetical protein
MKNSIKYISLAAFLVMLFAVACEKKYTFGKITTPTDPAISTTIQGASTTTPAGDGSGNITITATASNALAYKFYFGNDDSLISSSGIVNYKYTTLGTNQYTISVNAIGTGGATTTINKQVSVYYLFQIPGPIDAALTGGTSKSWMVAKDSAGNFGVGPATSFTPDYYSSGPNEKPSCAYGSVITFTHVADNNISINVNNQGSSFVIGAATAFYGQSGGDGCYPVTTGGTQAVTFGTDAFAGSNTSNSTGIQMTIPGNGIINFGTGAKTYEVLSLTPKVMTLRAIGVDGLAWYTVLKSN